MGSEPKIKEGDKLPSFCLPDQNETEFCSDSLLGSWTVVYFYPKDNTSGCTTEAKDFTALKDEFKKLGAEIVGISKDSVASHQKFVIKHELGIRLLSDVDKKVHEQFGVWQLKKMGGREYMGTVRSTFLFNPEGVAVRVWPKVRVKGHVEEVLSVLQELQK